jgi:hypothetical protein
VPSSANVPGYPRNIPLLTLNSVVHPVLTAGVTYWFLAQTGPTGNKLCPGLGPFDPVTCPGGNDVTVGALWDNVDQGTGGIWLGFAAPINASPTSHPIAIELDGPILPPGFPTTATVPVLSNALLLVMAALLGLSGLFWMRRPRLT